MPRGGLVDMPLLCVAAASGCDVVSVDMLCMVERRCGEGDRVKFGVVRQQACVCGSARCGLMIDRSCVGKWLAGIQQAASDRCALVRISYFLFPKRRGG